MSTKAIMWIIIFLAAIAAIWYLWSRSILPATVPDSGKLQVQEEQALPLPGQPSSADAASRDASNAALDNDLTIIDMKAGAAADANASAQSFNDTPVQQAQ